MEEPLDIAAEIRAEAARQGIGTADLAEKTGLAYKTVSRKTNGRTGITVDELFKFADALDVPASTLIARADEHAAPAAA